MGLERYREKRAFRATPEPRGRIGRGKRQALRFVVQKHAARQLHYDFRLELHGVLLSWAVPKGPSLDPHDKRLAMHVEDHPLDYGAFEGAIPPDQYGSGAVIVWDRGTWHPLDDPDEGYEQGHLKFELDGEKLKGRWALIRTRGSQSGGKGDNAWLLIKESDEQAKRGRGARIVESEPDSAVSGRSLEALARGKAREWRPNRSAAADVHAGAQGAGARPKSVRAAKSSRATASARERSGADPAPAPSTRVASRAAPRRKGTDAAEVSADTVAGVRLSHPDKELFPEARLAKRDLAHYYEEIAEWTLPHLRDRPLALVRCPDGWRNQCFFQKHADKSVNAAVTRVEIPAGKNEGTYCSANALPALVALVQWGVIELHPWGSRLPRLDRPDRLIFDFDPDDGVHWKQLVEAVTALRALLADVGLEGFLKTTGGKGLHVVVPIRATIDWEEARGFTKALADKLVSAYPDRFTATASKAQRKGRIFIDYLRNTAGATAIAPYGVRARANAPVSTPIAWTELAADVRFDYFKVGNIPGRLSGLREDPWAKFGDTRQTVTKAMFRRIGYAGVRR